MKHLRSKNSVNYTRFQRGDSFRVDYWSPCKKRPFVPDGTDVVLDKVLNGNTMRVHVPSMGIFVNLHAGQDAFRLKVRKMDGDFGPAWSNKTKAVMDDPVYGVYDICRWIIRLPAKGPTISTIVTGSPFTMRTMEKQTKVKIFKDKYDCRFGFWTDLFPVDRRDMVEKLRPRMMWLDLPASLNDRQMSAVLTWLRRWLIVQCAPYGMDQSRYVTNPKPIILHEDELAPAHELLYESMRIPDELYLQAVRSEAKRHIPSLTPEGDPGLDGYSIPVTA